MEDIRIEDLAKICHISETHFRRVFTSHMKVSPLEYINSVRIHTACEFLQKTDIPVADIAHKCGFTTNSTFNRNFRQIMGVTRLNGESGRRIMNSSFWISIFIQRKDGKKVMNYKIVEQVSRKKKSMSESCVW